MAGTSGSTSERAAVVTPRARSLPSLTNGAAAGVGINAESAACSLSDISGWRAGVLYPLAGGGRESGAAHFVARPARAGAAAAFVLVIFRFGATMELGRSERTTLRPLWSYRVDGANSPDRKPR